MNLTHATAIRSALVSLFAFFTSALTIVLSAVLCFYTVSWTGTPEHWSPWPLIPLIGIYSIFTVYGSVIAGRLSRSSRPWPALAATGPYLFLALSQSSFRQVANLFAIAFVTFLAYYGAQRWLKSLPE
jgi:hypothetical protein